MFTSALFSFLLPALVSAHGFVSHVSIDGTDYPGNSVGTTATVKSPIRQIDSNGPVKGTSNPNLSCGQNAQLAADVANANPGSTVKIYWVGGVSGTTDPWPHVTGPLMHYMAKCDGSCTTYNASNAEWFKIAQQGQKPGSSSNWYQEDLKTGPATITIPSGLAAGNYLLRTEIITLQLAMTQGGVEFYPACIQLSVGGSQSGQPTTSEEATFPGAYSNTDPGILTPNVYNPGFVYQFPGPAVANFTSSGSGSGTSGSSSAAPTPTNGSPSSTPSAPAPSSMPSTPANPGNNPPGSLPSTSMSAPPAYPTPSPSNGTTTCKRRRAPAPEVRVVVDKKRMHRRRFRTSH